MRAAIGAIARALLLFGATQSAHAATVQVQVLLDLDNNALTGCSIVVPTLGTFSGAEQVLTTTVDTTANMVTAVSRQVCTGGVLGAPIPVNSPYNPPWPIGPGAGVGGSTLIETYVRLSDIPFTGISLRAGFVTTDQIGQQDAILNANPVFPAGLPDIPTLSQWGLILLAVLLSAAALFIIKRAGAGTAFVILLAVLLAGGVALAAITLTGNPADWVGAQTLATKAPGANPTRADIYAAYAVGDGVSLFFRLDVKLCPVITVNPNTLPPGSTSAAYPTTNFTQVGGTLPVTWSETGALPSGMSFTAAGVLSGSPTQTGTFPITFKATDANLCAGFQAITLTINACPAITVTPNTLVPGTANAAYGPVTFTAAGGSGAIAWSSSGALPTGMSFSAGGVFSGTPTQTGSFPITFTATDSLNCTGSQPITLVINCQAITVTNPGVTTGTANTAFSQTFTQAGAIGATTFTLASGVLPTGLNLASNGTLSGTPTQTGSFPITVRATDANGCQGTGATYNLVINCQIITVTNPATTTGTVNSPFLQTFSQSNAIGTTTYTTASTLPAGLTLTTSGILAGTPTQPGTFPIVATVTDANGCTGTSPTYTLVIGCQTITVSNPATSTGTVNSPFSQTFTQVGAIGGATFTTASALPTGVTLATNGILSGTPAQAGSFPIVVTVTDGNGCTGNSPTYTLVISCQAMSVGPASVPQGTVSVLYPTVTFTQTGGIGAVVFSETGALPTGLNFTGGASGVLSGTPTQSGSFPITVKATDSNGCFATHDYLVVVVCSGTSITLSPGSLPTVTVSTPFPSTTFTASGGVGPYTFSKAGALPAGMNFVTDTLSGTPTQTGIFPITISATDTVGGCVGSQDYVVTVTCSGVTITVAPGSLLAGAPGTPYGAVTFTASGGTGPYTFTEVGALPTGMSFSVDTLSGTPTKAGTFPVTVTATDAAGCTGATSYTLSIVCQAINVTNPATTSGTVDTAFSQTFTQTGAIGSATFTTASALPSGLTLSSAGVLSGTPGQQGTFPITVTVTDSNGCTGTGSTYTLVIACQAITVSNPGVTTGTVDAAFSQTFTQVGVGSHTPANFTLNSGSLPSGMTLSAGGVLSGPPGQPGSFPITVKVTDANGCTGIGPTYTLVVACQTITVTNPATTAAVFNTPFSQNFTQVGVGTHTPANFTTASTLPTGMTLALNGTLSGTPSVTGTFPITVTVTDANGCTGASATTYNLTVAPVAVADSYSGLVDNTQFVVTGGTTGSPATPFVGTSGAVTFRLTNNDLPSGGVALTTGTFATTAGGSVTLAADGTFIYTPKANPALAATTSDTFTYTISSNTGGTATAVAANGTATLTLAGRVWYVKNNGAAGNGQSQSTFQTLAAGVAASTANDNIFVYRGDGTTTNLATTSILKSSQKFIGEGAALVVNSNTLVPAGLFPLIGHTLILANNVTVDGIDMSTGSSRGITNLNGVYNTVTGVSVTARNVTSTTGTAIDVQGAGNTGTMTFRAVTANGGASGIVLQNFTGGSFTITGGGGVSNDGSGGTIQNTTADGILLNNTVNVSLGYMNINNSGTDSIRITSINGFTLNRSNISDSAGTAPADKAVDIGDFSTGTAVNGTINITNNVIGPAAGSSPHDSLAIGIGSGTSTWNVTNNTFRNTGNAGINMELRGGSVATAFLVDTCTFAGAGSATSARGIFVNTLDDAVMTLLTIQNNTFTNNNIHIDLNQQNDTDPVGGHTFKILNNTTMTGANSHAINIFAAAGSFAGTFQGRIENNVIGSAGVAGSGSSIGNGIRVNINGGSVATMLLNGNTIRQTPNGRGIEVIGRNGTGGLDVTVTSNDVDPQDTSGFPLSAILVQSNCVTVCNTVRSDIRLNTVPLGVTTDLLPTYLGLVETGASTSQVVDSPPASVDCTVQLTSTNTGSASASAGCTLIPGPINTPP